MTGERALGIIRPLGVWSRMAGARMVATAAALALAFALVSGAALAQGVAESPVPDRRLIVTEGIDYPGGDIRQVFDTTYQTCLAICRGDPDCVGFTFNSRSLSCFPKRETGAEVPFAGAVSGRFVATPQSVISRAAAAARTLDFLTPGDFDAARAQAAGLGDTYRAGGLDRRSLLDAAAGSEGSGAVRIWGEIVALGDGAPDWVALARAFGQLAETDRNARGRLRDQMRNAAINAALRAEDAVTLAEALVVLAEALELTGRPRDMIPALRLAQAAVPDAGTQAALDRAIGLYGFRLVEHRVESDAAQPRICAVFSEDLVPAGVDYAPFVQTRVPGLSVESEGRQICIGGVVHGQRYEITFRPGLPSASGETLAEAATLALYVRDRAPSVRFPGRGYVLPAAGPLALPVETVNADTVTLALRRFSDRNLVRAIADETFASPLAPWEDEALAATEAETIWTGSAEIAGDLNRATTTRLPLADMAGALEPGVYLLRAALAGADPWEQPGATQWFIVSDLGLATYQGADGLHVVVRSLATANARQGVRVQLVSRGNAVLAEAVTDARGVASFAPGLVRGRGPAAPALVLAETDGSGGTMPDLAFLSLTDPAFDLSDRGVEGRDPAGAVDVFLTTERGAYRAGETVHVTALARDPDARSVPGLPLVARLMRPDGVEYSREQPVAVAAGGHVFALELGGEVPRGVWRVEVLSDPDAPPLASRTLAVEDFLPERIDLAIALPETPVDPAAMLSADLEARYLFGAPAADLAVEGEAVLRPVAEREGWAGYVFGGGEAAVTPERTVFGDIRTDEDGRAALRLALPQVAGPEQPLELTLTARVLDGANRPVERSVTRPVRPAATMLGLRPLFDGVVPDGAEARFDVALVDPDGRAEAGALRWTLSRVERQYQWYSTGGRWFWEPVTLRNRVAEGTLALDAASGRLVLPVDAGRYELRVDRTDGAPALAVLPFSAGWYAAEGATDTPDLLDVALDRATYAAGDVAQVRVQARSAGVAVVSVLSDRLVDLRLVDVAEGETEIPLEVTDAWGSGAYVAVSLLQPMRRDMGRNPARALGIAHAAVDPADRALDVTLEAPSESDPRAALPVTLRVTGAAPGETVWATVAAVDQGILNLTGFVPPDPQAHYFGQRRLGVELRDVYGRLIDGMAGAMGTVRSGGDAGAVRRQAEPPTEALLALFQGPVAVGPDGTLPLRFDMPAFNGSVRLMAVVWSDRAVGQADAEVLVRDPVVVQASLPRFLAPGDDTVLGLEITHASGPAGDLPLAVSAGPGLTLGAVPPAVTLAAGGRARVSVPLSAVSEGRHRVNVALTLPDGRVLERAVTLDVARNDPETLRLTRLTLEPGQTLTLGADVFAGFAPGSGTATLAAGPLARLNLAGLLRQLDAYPYGCAEQVTSTALPLLYLSDLSADAGLATPADLRARIDDAIRHVLTFQASSGSFGLWFAASGDLWLDAYVTDFLSRARDRGHEVPETAFRMALDNLRNRINYAPQFDRDGAPWAYALHVLAREGEAAVGDLRYYADERAAAFDTPLAAAHLGAALAAYGDPARADRMFAQAARLVAAGGVRDGWRDDYGTPMRDLAGVLTLATTAGSQAAPADRLTVALTDAVQQRMAAGRGLSTQEAAWTLLAADALRASAAGASLTVDGQAVRGPVLRQLTDEEGALRETALVNSGDRPADVTLTVFGVPQVPEPPGGTTLRLTRSHFTLDGVPVTPEDLAAGIPVGTRLVTVLDVQVFEGAGGRLMVDDPLPAGFEIDNPNLLRAGDVRALDWLDGETGAAFTEARADRFLAAIDRQGGGDFRLAYIVRAVSPGSFHHPAALVEDMYRPTARAVGATGRLRVTE